MRTMRRYVLPMSADESGFAGLDSILDAGASVPAVAEETVVEATVTDPAATEVTDPAQPAQPTATKADHAFAQLRTERDNYSKLLAKVASAAGIQYANEQDLVTKLNDDAIGKLAQQQNVPVELLKRLEAMEQDSKVLQETKRQEAAISSFQTIMSTYELNNDELRTFAAKLDEIGKNPFQQDVNLEAEYRNLFFDDIVNKRVEKAVQAALTKDANVSVHSTAPNKAVGGTSDPVTKISTVKGLDAFLDGK